MIESKTITIELDGEIREVEVDFEYGGLTAVKIESIGGQDPNSFSFADQVAVKSRITALKQNEYMRRGCQL